MAEQRCFCACHEYPGTYRGEPWEGWKAERDAALLRADAAEQRAAYGRAAERGRDRPTIVCLCGSTRFYDAFQQANYRETMAGRIVLSVGFYPHSAVQAHGEQIGCTPEQKAALDALHLEKIALADEVLVLNVGGYVGDSTRREIAHARALGKPIRWLDTAATPAGEGGGGVNYLDKIAARIQEVADPDPAPEYFPLYRIYAVLALAKGLETTAEDVHNAWSAWAADWSPEHRSLRPFYELESHVQALDDPFVVAIHQVAVEIAGEGEATGG